MKLGIRIRLIVFSALITLLVVCAILTHTLYFGRLNKLATYTENSLNTQQVVSRALANHMYFMDIQALRKNLSYVLLSPQVDCALLLDSDGYVLLEVSQSNSILCEPDSSMPALLGQQQSMTVNQHDNLFVFGKVIVPDEQVVGYLMLGFPLSELEQSILDDFKAYSLIALVALLLGFILATVLSKRFSQPLREIAYVAQRIGGGELSVRLTINRSDEIGVLAEAINQMAEHLSRSTVSKQYLDNVLHSLGEALVITDKNLLIQEVNYASQLLLACRESELKGYSLLSLFNDGAGLSEQQLKQLFVHDGVRSLETELVSKAGTIIPILLTVTRVQGRYTGREDIVWIARDIGDRKMAELELSESYDRLTQSNEELKIAQAQLVQSAKMANLGEISAGLAHEINQPLGALRLHTELINSLIERRQEDKIAKVLPKSLHQIDRISKIISHLKVFSHGGSEQLKEAADLNELVAEALLLLENSMFRSGICLTKQLAKDLPNVECNYIQIEQVITNLLTNARDAVQESAVKEIVIRSFQDKDKVCIEIKDTGPGIPADILKKLYSPFFTTKSVGKGTGLGLSISYGIVKEHNGEIRLDTILEQGSRFTVVLPLKKQAQDKEAEYEKNSVN